VKEGVIILANTLPPCPSLPGMLLEMDVSELIAIIETPAELQAKIKEAHEVLVAAQQQQAAGLPADAAPAQ